MMSDNKDMFICLSFSKHTHTFEMLSNYLHPATYYDYMKICCATAHYLYQHTIVIHSYIPKCFLSIYTINVYEPIHIFKSKYQLYRQKCYVYYEYIPRYNTMHFCESICEVIRKHVSYDIFWYEDPYKCSIMSVAEEGNPQTQGTYPFIFMTSYLRMITPTLYMTIRELFQIYMCIDNNNHIYPYDNQGHLYCNGVVSYYDDIASDKYVIFNIKQQIFSSW